jgi:hypothetical protein
MSQTSHMLIRTGYDFRRVLRLTLDGAAEDVSGATAIYASVKNMAKTSELIADTLLSSVDTGAAWASGLVTVSFTAAQTALISQAQEGWLEIALKTGGKRLPYEDLPVIIETGYALT